MPSTQNSYKAPIWCTAELCRYLIDKSKNDPARVLFVNNARRWREWYRGHLFLAPTKGFDDTSVPEVNATSRRNIIGETVDAASSIFLKNTPIIRRIPLQTRWADLSDDMDAMWFWQWREAFGQVVMRSLLEESEITGLGVVKVYWDHHRGRRRTNGGIVLQSTPSNSIYVDPDASNDHRAWDASYIGEEMMRFPEEVMAKYGRDAEKALGYRTGNAGQSAKSGTPRAWQMDNMSREDVVRRIDGGVTQRPNFPFQTSGPSGKDGKVKVNELWLFPDKLYGSELSTGDKTPEHFRHGLVATMVNDVIVRVRPNPSAQQARIPVQNDLGQETRAANWLGHGSHPYVFLHWRRSSDSDGNRRFYNTMSMVEWMASLQFNVNALRRNMAIILRTMANPMFAYNEDALGTPANQIVCAPGQMIKVRGRYQLDQAIKAISPSQMPPQVESMIMSDIEAMKEAAAVQRGVTGLFPSPAGGTSHTSGDVIGGLQEASFGPLWKYVEQFGDALEDVSTKMEGLMQQHFTQGHYVASSRRGVSAMVEWTGEHRIAQFRRIVVAGATTPIFDQQREAREGFIKEQTVQAILSGDQRVIRLQIIFLGHMNFPWTEDYAQLLEEELTKLQQMEAEVQKLGAFSMLNGGQPQGLPAPQGQGVPQQSVAPQQQQPDLSVLADQMGVSPEQLMIAASERG